MITCWINNPSYLWRRGSFEVLPVNNQVSVDCFRSLITQERSLLLVESIGLLTYIYMYLSVVIFFSMNGKRQHLSRYDKVVLDDSDAYSWLPQFANISDFFSSIRKTNHAKIELFVRFQRRTVRVIEERVWIIRRSIRMRARWHSTFE